MLLERRKGFADQAEGVYATYVFKKLKPFISFLLCLLLVINISAQSYFEDVYLKYFLIGVALNSNQFNERDKNGADLVKNISTLFRPKMF